MSARTVSVAVVIACVLAVPVAAADPGGTVVASANGGVHWTIPLPNAFGVVVQNRTLTFNARRYEDGSVSGRFEYHQVVEGDAFKFNVDVTCFVVYDGNRAKIGGVVAEQRSDRPGRHVRVVPGLRRRRGPRRTAGPFEPGRVRRRGCQRGLLQQPEPPSLRALGPPGQRAGPGLASRPGRERDTGD